LLLSLPQQAACLRASLSPPHTRSWSCTTLTALYACVCAFRGCQQAIMSVCVRACLGPALCVFVRACMPWSSRCQRCAHVYVRALGQRCVHALGQIVLWASAV
jgi:hypothetical protein